MQVMRKHLSLYSMQNLDHLTETTIFLGRVELRSQKDASDKLLKECILCFNILFIGIVTAAHYCFIKGKDEGWKFIAYNLKIYIGMWFLKPYCLKAWVNRK